MTVLRDEHAALDSVAALISMDQGLAARVLSLSNSAYYGPGERSYCIQDAATRVGIVKVYELVSHAAASQLLMHPLRTYGLGAGDVWRNSLSCAIAAEMLARRLGLEGPAAYTLGLLHLCGLVALDRWNEAQPEPIRLARGSWPDENTREEVQAFGFTNAAVAAALLRRWRFPAARAEAEQWQYLPCRADSCCRTLACVLHVAKWLRDAAFMPDGQPPPPLPDGPVLSIVRVGAEDIEPLRMEVRGDCENAMLLLADIGGAPS